MITLDTSALLALFNRADPHHAEARAALDDEPGPLLVPAGILAEVAYVLEARHGIRALDHFLQDLEQGAFALYCGERDLGRVRELVSRDQNLPRDFSDAAVVACAERHGGRVLRFDRRDFDQVEEVVEADAARSASERIWVDRPIDGKDLKRRWAIRGRGGEAGPARRTK
jgi:uncharacterized protein